MENFSFSSCVKSDVWHPEKGPAGYEWWYFDALSDDEKESVVIIFLDNLVFSPRYNALNRKLSGNGGKPEVEGPRFPAVAFFHSRDGKVIHSSVTEHSEEEFSADPEWPYCRIGESFFKFDSAPYGTGFDVQVKTRVREGTLDAHFEWLSIESDLAPESFGPAGGVQCWNLVSPRSDVTGKLAVRDSSGRALSEKTFRGTGYHDHMLDLRWLPETVSAWNRGRAHFTDSTAVYFDYKGIDPDSDTAKLLLIRNNEIVERDAEIEVQEYGRDWFGVKYPSRLRIVTGKNERLRIKRQHVIDSSLVCTRFLHEATLTLRDGVPRRSYGIGEFMSPGRLRRGWLDWLIDLKIGKKGRLPLLG